MLDFLCTTMIDAALVDLCDEKKPIPNLLQCLKVTHKSAKYHQKLGILVFRKKPLIFGKQSPRT